MRILTAAAMIAVALPFAATGADAQQRGRHERDARQDCRRDLRHADSRGEYRHELRDCQRDIARARAQDWRTYRRYDWNRPPPGGAYYADQYYRDGRYYRERRLSRNDRIYRGRDGRYYCRRPDGTTGLIVGAAVGGLIGNAIDDGRSSLLGTLIGAAAGGALGREVERGGIRCR
jgi:hypothetical protein